MPIFDYKCTHCKRAKTKEILVRSADEIVPCDKCGNPMEKEISGKFKFQFKVGHGSGTAGGHTMQ